MRPPVTGYIGDPIKSLYSELSGFEAETVTG